MENISWILVTMGVSLLLCSILVHKIGLLKIDVIYLRKDFERKLKIQDTLHQGLQGEVIEFKVREQALNKQFYGFLKSIEDRFDDPVEDVDFHALLETLKKETL